MAKKEQNPEGLALIVQLAGKLGVDLENSHVAIATEEIGASVRMYDGSLEARILPSSDHRCMYVDSPRSPSIYIELVDHQRDTSVPDGAVYSIRACMPLGNMGLKNYNDLNGDVWRVYVGKNGIILDDPARRRAADLVKVKK